jgi:hypothetical protein
MLYQISRGGQTYGPYTLADLKRYVDSGHVLLSDLAKSDEMAEWATVAEILNPAGLPPAAPPAPAVETAFAGAYAPQPVYAPVAQYSDPPNLHWGLVLLFDLVTLELFQMVWNLIFSTWMQRVQPNSKALLFYIVGYVLTVVHAVMYVPLIIVQMQHVMANDIGFQPHYAHRALISLIWFVAWVLKLVARFSMKSSLEEHYNTVEPIGFRMSGVLTFFFGGLYIQSQLNRINEIKRAIRYQSYGR